MVSLRTTTVALGMLALVAVAPQSSLAQQGPVEDDCNQPMRESISYVTVGQPSRPHVSPDGCWIFVNSADGPAVLRRRGGVIEQHRVLDVQGQVRGLTHDGKMLVLATTEAIFVDVERLVSGDRNVILGRDTDRHFSLRHSMGLTTKDNYLFLVQTTRTGLASST